ncbi:hypothetical protein HDF17_002439 [Granulicella arctica]|uniref:Uncharacterized protein n=1 Tax=Granulicella arctica TaxID=940613 RepID=A0A7Y9PHQ3_9BACT|nr:hypothetical protein [Granulicella arctica]
MQANITAFTLETLDTPDKMKSAGNSKSGPAESSIKLPKHQSNHI